MLKLLETTDFGVSVFQFDGARIVFEKQVKNVIKNDELVDRHFRGRTCLGYVHGRYSYYAVDYFELERKLERQSSN
jgi:hypothetical protein